MYLREMWVLILCLSSVVLSSTLRTGSDTFKVHCQTTKGPLDIEVYPDWAPLGARRFLELVVDDFYTDIAFFRCVKGFLTQFGISDHADKLHWHRANIPDDPNLRKGIKKHYLSFAGGGPNTRSTQLFIAFEDLDFLGEEPWETPFGMPACCVWCMCNMVGVLISTIYSSMCIWKRKPFDTLCVHVCVYVSTV
ncbi:hypothetical protein EON64_17365 [archaeon]|nr:MAG: hypothetical protein EON64_17365 [archaeon]